MQNWSSILSSTFHTRDLSSKEHAIGILPINGNLTSAQSTHLKQEISHYLLKKQQNVRMAQISNPSPKKRDKLRNWAISHQWNTLLQADITYLPHGYIRGSARLIEVDTMRIISRVEINWQLPEKSQNDFKLLSQKLAPRLVAKLM